MSISTSRELSARARLGKTFGGVLTNALGLTRAPGIAAAGGDWATQAECERRLGLSDWNRQGVLAEVLRRLAQPPFTNQLDRESRRKQFEEEMQSLRQRMTDAEATNSRAIYVEALAKAPDEHRLHENYGEFLEARGELAAAEREWKVVARLLPHHHLGWFQSGRLLARLGKFEEARKQLTQAVTLRPDLSEGWLELGILSASEGRFEAALSEYDRALKLTPAEPRVHYWIGRAFSKLNRSAEAIASFRRALKLLPEYWEARYALGEELAFSGQVAQAKMEFEKVLEQRPGYAMAHLNLGVALVQEGSLLKGSSTLKKRSDWIRRTRWHENICHR
jgi:tetratricopeptide (TPR) repeat protein